MTAMALQQHPPAGELEHYACGSHDYSAEKLEALESHICACGECAAEVAQQAQLELQLRALGAVAEYCPQCERVMTTAPDCLYCELAKQAQAANVERAVASAPSTPPHRPPALAATDSSRRRWRQLAPISLAAAAMLALTAGAIFVNSSNSDHAAAAATSSAPGERDAILIPPSDHPFLRRLEPADALDFRLTFASVANGNVQNVREFGNRLEIDFGLRMDGLTLTNVDGALRLVHRLPRVALVGDMSIAEASKRSLDALTFTCGQELDPLEPGQVYAIAERSAGKSQRSYKLLRVESTEKLHAPSQTLLACANCHSQQFD